MSKTCIYSAIGTPLTNADLNHEGLEAHLDDQWNAGIDGVLVAGTMGAMPLLLGSTYEQLIRESARLCRGRGRLLVGVGDVSYARTKERIELANQFEIDGVVVLTPFFVPFSQQELILYYTSLAEQSKFPLYLYDLPQRTGTALTLDTILQLAKNPRIAGIKISGDANKGRRVLRETDGDSFSVFFADATSLDLLIRSGFSNHLDGIYCIVPRLVRSIADAAEIDDRNSSQQGMALLDSLLTAVVRHGVFPSLSALLNHRGIPGSFAPAPFAPLDPKIHEQLLSEPGVQDALRIG